MNENPNIDRLSEKGWLFWLKMIYANGSLTRSCWDDFNYYAMTLVDISWFNRVSVTQMLN